MATTKLGTLIRRERNIRGNDQIPLSIRAAAKEIGIGHTSLHRIEHGQNPDFNSFRLICNWLKIGTQDLHALLGMETADNTKDIIRLYLSDNSQTVTIVKNGTAIDMNRATFLNLTGCHINPGGSATIKDR